MEIRMYGLLSRQQAENLLASDTARNFGARPPPLDLGPRQPKVNQGPTAEDILRERLRIVEGDRLALIDANSQLRIKIAAIENELIAWQACLKVTEAALAKATPKPDPEPVDPIHRALKFGAGNHMRIGLIT